MYQINLKTKLSRISKNFSKKRNRKTNLPGVTFFQIVSNIPCKDSLIRIRLHGAVHSYVVLDSIYLLFYINFSSCFVKNQCLENVIMN